MRPALCTYAVSSIARQTLRLLANVPTTEKQIGSEVSFHMCGISFFDVRSHSDRSSEQSYRSGLGAVKLEIEKAGSSHVEPQD